MFFSVMMLCSIFSLNALPYSLGRKCVAQQAVCLYFISCKTPFTCNCVPDKMFPPCVKVMEPKKSREGLLFD